MTDIVERLDACADDPMWAAHCEMSKATARKAAAEITRLRAEAEALRKALAAIVDRDFTFFDGCVDRNTITYGEIQQARSALDATKGTT